MYFQNYYVTTVTWLIEYLSIRKINLCLDCADTGKIKYRETKLSHKVDCFASCFNNRQLDSKEYDILKCLVCWL